MATSNCDWFLERLEDYVDGELSPASQPAFEEHRRRCVACRDELALAQRIQKGLRAMPAAPCPQTVETAVATVSAARSGRLGAAAWPRVLFGIAAAAVIALGGWFFMAPEPEERDPATVANARAAEVAEAEERMKWTLAFLGAVHKRSMERFEESVIRDGVAAPMADAAEILRDPEPVLEDE